MKDLLLPVDESEQRGTTQAETVTDLFGTDEIRAHVVHVFRDNPEGASVTRVAAVRRAMEHLKEVDIDVELHEASGDPSDEIVQVAEDIDVDAICIAGRKRSPTGKLVFGSVTQDVVLNTERPVLVCGASGTDGTE